MSFFFSICTLIVISFVLITITGCTQDYVIDSIDPKCMELWERAHTYCIRFEQLECDNKTYDEPSELLKNPVDCFWEEKSTLCEARGFCQ